MQCDDLLCRAVIFPKAWNNDIFDVEALLLFTSEDSRRYALSLASRFLLQDLDGAHAYGCRAAAASNSRFREKNGREPNPIDEAAHYLGFYDLRFEALTGLRLNHYSVSVRWRYENGEDAHFQVELDPTGTGSKAERRNDRTAMKGLVALCLIGPTRGGCANDEAIAEELAALVLPVCVEATLISA